MYTSHDTSRRAIISELANSSIAQGVIFFDGKIFRVNSETCIEKKDDSGKLLIESSDLRDRIEGHFERKILLFYSLTIACFKGFCSHLSGSFLEIGETDYQIGKGDLSKGLSGAHSSLIARINLKFDPTVIIDKFADYEVNDRLDAYERSVHDIASQLSRLDLLTPIPQDIHLAKIWVNEMLKSFCSSYIPIESYLGQNLASTMCLPLFCNKLDSALENYLRKDCILILNDVYKGRKTPLEASREFAEILHEALKRIKVAYESIKKNRDETSLGLRSLLDIFINLNSPDCKTAVVDFSKLYQNPSINPIVCILHLKAPIEKILSKTISSYIEDLKGLIRPDLVDCGVGLPDIFFDKTIPIDPKTLPFDLMKRVYARVINKLKIDIASIGYLSEFCLDFPQGFENEAIAESDEELLQLSLRSWFIDLLNSTIKGKHKIFLPSTGFDLESIRKALISELQIMFDFDDLERARTKFKRNTLKSLNELLGSATIEEKIHLIPIIDLYLELMPFVPKQLQYFFQSSSTEEELMISQTQLLKKKHNVYFSKLSAIGTDPNFLNIPIFFVLERVKDCLQYPKGLKLTIDKPEYFHTPHFSLQFKNYLVSSCGSSLSLAVGDIKSGMFWI